MPARFTDELRREAEPLWRAQLEHPFVRGLADGTLDPERFRFFVRQDYLFLLDYARVLVLAAERAPTAELRRRFEQLAAETATTELDLHRALVPAAELEAERPAPATRAYAEFLLRSASEGGFAELAASVLPCMWGYSELGRSLAAGPVGPRYAGWIELYASEEFAGLAAWCRELVDGLATPEAREPMRAAFVESSRHELAFWDMGWGEVQSG